MIIYFADRTMNILGFGSIEGSGLTITNDNYIQSIEEGVSVFEADILFSNNERAEAEEWLSVGNFVLRSEDGETCELFTTIESEMDVINNTIHIYCEDAGLDLINKSCIAAEFTEAHPIAYYINQYIAGSNFVIGIDELGDSSNLKLSFNEETGTARINSIATQFNAEISYSYKIDTRNKLKVAEKNINIHKKRGGDYGTELRLKRDINNIVVSKSVANVATAMKPIGQTESGAQMTLKGTAYSYDDGDIYSPIDSA